MLVLLQFLGNAIQLPSLMPNRMHSTRAARAHKRRQPIVNICDAVINIYRYTTVILLRITQANHTAYTMKIDCSDETSTLFISFRRSK